MDNKEYQEYLENKKSHIEKSGFFVDEKDLNPRLFPFQKFCVQRALEHGKFALFEDCGLGKTFQQLEWSQKVVEHTCRPVIIFAPLGVVGQTIKEGQRFGYEVKEIESTEKGIGGASISPTMTIWTTLMLRISVGLYLMKVQS